MKLYYIEKWNEKGIVADYGSYADYEDIKAITKGYSLDDEMKEFGLLVFTRKNCKTYYVMEIKER